MRSLAFEKKALEQFEYWEQTDPKTAGKIVALLSDICKTPFTGIGKPEPLKHQLGGY
jgi:toxin YoeB